MAVTAAMVKELREMTGAGMMDCKKALTATEGDMDAAVEFLRKNGQAKAEKKAGRIAAEGICRIAVKDEGTAAVVEVNSETDFVAKNEKFQNFVAAVAEQAVNSDNTELEAFLDEAWHEEPSKTVKEVLVEQIAVIGENLKIRRFQKVTAPLVVSYTHGGGRIGVLVEADTDVKNDAVKEALTNVAMQIAALSPKYVSTADVSEEYKAHEKEILMAQIQNDPKMAGKPEGNRGRSKWPSEQRAEGSLPVRAGIRKGRGRQADRCSVFGSGSKREQCKPDCKGLRSFRNR